jgi:hypothetical protein
MAEIFLQSNSSVAELIEFQANFLNLVHTQIYASSFAPEEVTMYISQALLKFQINYITDINEKYNLMVR